MQRGQQKPRITYVMTKGVFLYTHRLSYSEHTCTAGSIPYLLTIILSKILFILCLLHKFFNFIYTFYYYHSIGHSLGMDTHDIETPHRDITFEPGVIFTVEPGIYIEEEGIGIRIEDDILVTEDGVSISCVSIPKLCPIL